MNALRPYLPTVALARPANLPMQQMTERHRTANQHDLRTPANFLSLQRFNSYQLGPISHYKPRPSRHQSAPFFKQVRPLISQFDL